MVGADPQDAIVTDPVLEKSTSIESDLPDEDSAAPLEDDPAFGKYLSNYPSRRGLLLMQAAIFYFIPVGVLQILFANVDDQTASIILPVLFAGLALAITWYVLHLWNREVILYERGFTYREGSRLGRFYYHEISTVRQNAERVAYFGIFRRNIYQCTLISQQDEIFKLTNVYSNIADLAKRIEALIAKFRQPIVEEHLNRGETIEFGALQLHREYARTDEKTLRWEQFTDYKIEGKNLVLQAREDADTLSVPVTEVDNLVLLLRLLKDQRATA